MAQRHPVGQAALIDKGWLASHRLLLARRISQLGILAAFLAGPLTGVWIFKGTIGASRFLDTITLTDPVLLAQTLAAGQLAAASALAGAALVVGFYLLVGGRVFCAWVCPINLVTDAAHWVHRRLHLPKGWQPARQSRYWLLAAVLGASWATGTAAWEWINPVTLSYRGLLFGLGYALPVVGAVAIFDLLVARRGWCGRLCPVGAGYGLLGTAALLRVSAHRRAFCDDCLDCFAVCPEPQVLTPALRGGPTGASPVITSADCTNCGRCLDICAQRVFRFTHRFDRSEETAEAQPSRADAA